MGTLSALEKIKLEELLKMQSGYVLDFSDSSFRSFVLSSVNKDIYLEKYKIYGNSKANRLRAFWDLESKLIIGKLLTDLVDLRLVMDNRLKMYGEFNEPKADPFLVEECINILKLINEDKIVPEIDSIQAINDDEAFAKLAENIRETIDKNEPEIGLDRLHTFFVKFIRALCVKHRIAFSKEESLNAIFGKYVKCIKQKGMIDSNMAENILKYSMNILESFNKVRNDNTYAHDNPLLNYDESVLIFNNLVNSVKFIRKIEGYDS
ncbi:abortive infection family protein [Larkinella sp. GY13]|uniref:abortive infection family protein n=1 Tax=Larkinella sp. GY13 TaxID=3453720 RepID=UPI003EED88A1